MAWLWSKLTLRRRMKGREARRELLGYPRGSWQPLLDRLAHEIRSRGGRVLLDRPAAMLRLEGGRLVVEPGAPGSFRRGHNPRSFEPLGDPVAYDAVLATVPNDVFTALLDPGLTAHLDPGYMARLESIEYHTALCLLLELDRSLTRFYWTNVADPELPFVGLIEHTNLVEPERYGGHRIAYVANYLPPGHELLRLDQEELLATYEPGLRKLNGGFSRAWVRRAWAFREPAAQPIVTVGYQHRIPPLTTGVSGLALANTTQIYPEDRGTNYSVRLGTEAARSIAAPRARAA